MATILLFKDHEKFQVGKSRLKRGAIFQTNIIWISVLLIGAIGFIVVGGNSLRWQWRYQATGQETSGTVSQCREVSGSKGSYVTRVQYSYSVNETVYQDEDSLSGRRCDSYQTGMVYPVYFLSDAPTESGIGSFLHDSDWTTSYLFGVIGFGGMAFVFYLLLKNRKEQYKHALLQRHADTIIEAEVSYIGKVTGKGGYLYADYLFNSPDKRILRGKFAATKAIAGLSKSNGLIICRFYTWMMRRFAFSKSS